MMTQTSLSLVTRELVPEARRMSVTGKYLGLHFPLRIEPMLFDMAARIAPEYRGGYWDMFTLSNGGFYMAPAGDTSFEVTCQNQYRGMLSADALGITACLYAYSNLSFSDGRFARVCACHYHRLREYIMEHPEVSAILGATD